MILAERRRDLVGTERLDALGSLARVVVVVLELPMRRRAGRVDLGGRGLDRARAGHGEGVFRGVRLEARHDSGSHQRDATVLVDAGEEHGGADARHLHETAGGAPVERGDVLRAHAPGGSARGAPLSVGGDDDASTDAVGVQQEGAGRRVRGVDDVEGGGAGGAGHVGQHLSKR